MNSDDIYYSEPVTIRGNLSEPPRIEPGVYVRSPTMLVSMSEIMMSLKTRELVAQCTGEPVKEPTTLPAQLVRGAKCGRNEPCPCGSGKKYKRCCR